MKVIDPSYSRPVFQGDVMFTRCQEIPKEAKLIDGNIVAHSETGHHHVAEGAEVYTCDDGLTLYMQMTGLSDAKKAKAKGPQHVDVVHKRSFDTHETLRLLGNPGDIWKIRRQREYVPEGWRRVED